MTDTTAPSTPPDAGRTHATQRSIAASPEAVFGAFSDPERLARWWGPSGFSSTFREFDFRKCGYWRFTMHGPDGKNYPNECVFLDVVPNQRVVIEHVSDHHFILTISFRAAGNATVVSWEQVFDTAQHFRHIADFVGRANEENLDRLAVEVARANNGADNRPQRQA